MLKAYQYFFYKTYKFIKNNSIPNLWSQWRAIASMIILEIFLINSIIVYFHYFTGIQKDVTNGGIQPFGIIMLFILAGFNYYIFDHKSKWKNIIKKYDNLPKRKVDTGGILVAIISIAIIASYFFCIFYVMGQLKYKID